MLSSSILDVAIGMAFIYLLLSLIASVVQEAIASLVQTRSANLEHAIRSLFSGSELSAGKTFVDAIYQHGLIRGLYRDPTLDNRGTQSASELAKQEATGKPTAMPAVPAKKPFSLRLWLRGFLRIAESRLEPKTASDPFLLPAYIPSRTFAITVLDLLSADGTQADLLTNIEAKLKKLRDDAGADSEAAQALLSLLTDAMIPVKDIDKADKFRANLENWYNDAMDRASGWYKKYTQNILLVIGLLLAVAFNVDSIRVGTTLWFDKDSRQGLASAASTYIAKNTPTTDGKKAAPCDAGGKPPEGDSAKPDAGTKKKDPVDPKIREDKSTATSTATGAATGTAKQGDATVPSNPSNPCDPKAALADQMKTAVAAFNEVSGDYLLPVGWHYSKYSVDQYKEMIFNFHEWKVLEILRRVAGWFITALALSLGAPFWFDTLNKFMVVRSTVKPREKSQNEASKS